MQINKIEPLIYTIRKRFQGYKLLKNPKEAPSGYVRMVRHFNLINNRTCDVVDCYNRITKDCSKVGNPETQENLYTTKKLFFECNKPTYKREVHYSFFDLPTHAKSNDACKKVDSSKRDLSPLDMVVKKDSVLVPNVATSFLGFCLPKREIKSYTLRDILINKFYTNSHETEGYERKRLSNFFIVFLKNILK